MASAVMKSNLRSESICLATKVLNSFKFSVKALVWVRCKSWIWMKSEFFCSEPVGIYRKHPDTTSFRSGVCAVGLLGLAWGRYGLIVLTITLTFWLIIKKLDVSAITSMLVRFASTVVLRALVQVALNILVVFSKSSYRENCL